nr:CatB-related O-acetyltransferase [Paraglaciecola chathamensis]
MFKRLLKRIKVTIYAIYSKFRYGNVIQTSYIDIDVLKRFRNVKIMRDSTILGDVHIGEYSYLGRATEVCDSSIGRYCSIGNWVSIGVGEHDLNSISTNSIFMDSPAAELTKGTVNIGDDVWIGTKVTILRNIHIGKGAVIGAGAVVTKNIPAYAICVGVPAKIIKFRFDDKKIEKIEKSCWTNFPPTEAKKIFAKL